MDWTTFNTVAAITFGHAIGGAIVGSFFSWKAKRSEIRTVLRKGGYVDIAEVYERRAWIAWTVCVVSILAASGATFMTMP